MPSTYSNSESSSELLGLSSGSNGNANGCATVVAMFGSTLQFVALLQVVAAAVGAVPSMSTTSIPSWCGAPATCVALPEIRPRSMDRPSHLHLVQTVTPSQVTALAADTELPLQVRLSGPPLPPLVNHSPRWQVCAAPRPPPVEELKSAFWLVQIEIGTPVPPAFSLGTISALPTPVTEPDAMIGTSGVPLIAGNSAIVTLWVAAALSVSMVPVSETSLARETRVTASRPRKGVAALTVVAQAPVVVSTMQSNAPTS